MPISPKVYIILLNYNGWKHTIECLESLLKLDYPKFQIIVVDNKSTDNSMNFICEWAQNQQHLSYTLFKEENVNEVLTGLADTNLIFMEAKANRGFASGNNIALKYALRAADFKYVWLLNNDTVVEDNTLSELVKRAEADKSKGVNIGIWGSKLLHYYKRDTIQALGGRFNSRFFTTAHISENEVDSTSHNLLQIKQDYVIGASMFVRREFLEQVGLLNEAYFLYFEELDWAKRGRLHGFDLGYVYSSRVYHKEGKSISSDENSQVKSEVADYHGIRSKIIFATKFYPQKKFQLGLLVVGSVLLRLKRLQFKRAVRVIKLMKANLLS